MGANQPGPMWSNFTAHHIPGTSLPRLMKSSMAAVINREAFFTNIAGPEIISHRK